MYITNIFFNLLKLVYEKKIKSNEKLESKLCKFIIFIYDVVFNINNDYYYTQIYPYNIKINDYIQIVLFHNSTSNLTRWT